MTVLVTGGSKSGKSRVAEQILCDLDLPRIYLATMQPFGSEAREAIARHRAMRANKGFVTIERYTDLGEMDIPEGSAVLLECMGNLCANEMFSAKAPDPVGKIMDGIVSLAERCAWLVIVTNQVGEDGIVYAPETMDYLRILGEINCLTAQKADCVIETVCGIPLALKGALPSCLC